MVAREIAGSTCRRLRPLLLITAALALALAMVATAWPAANTLRVVTPPDGVWVTESPLFLAGTIVGPSLTVKISGLGAVKVREGGVFGGSIALDRGLNTIKLSGGNDKLAVRVFYAPDGKKPQPPQDFKRFYLHSKPAELSCRECHRLKEGAYDFKRLIPSRADCTSQCHQERGRAKHVHGPVGAGICISCHSPHGTFNPGFVPKPGAELCFTCHQGSRAEFSRPVVHPPVEDGCADCHDPHESPNRYQLLHDGDSLSGLCFSCHEEGMFTRENQHAPVAEGDCIACHRPHSSDHQALLIAPVAGGALCFQCHEDRQEDFEMEYLHAPAEESCVECHDPHSAKAQYMLKESGGALCATCHREVTPEIYETIAGAKVEHPPVSEGLCVKCHRPHSSKYPSLLGAAMEQLCLSCHAELGEIIAASSNRHGPVKTGDCTACHNVHGSLYNKLLVRHYPEEFYGAYAENKYDLCFGCHNGDIARSKRTTTLTDFRDGDYNLHYFHVNNEKGRVCTACHDPHASSQAKHIRYEVPFGAWSYPVNLTKTATGGGCVVGCHAPKAYDRRQPVVAR
jgi:predicted CXXCH cytochrome family protein